MRYKPDGENAVPRIKGKIGSHVPHVTHAHQLPCSWKSRSSNSMPDKNESEKEERDSEKEDESHLAVIND